MAGPGGRSVGRVSVRVVPDSTKFREDLKKFLNRVERQFTAKITVDADTREARARINGLIKEVDDKTLNVNVDANVEDAKHQIESLDSDRTVTVDANADTGRARMKMATLTRPRIIEVAVRLKKSSIARLNAALAGLSGARVLESTFKNIGRYLSDLDRHIPKLALTSLAVANIGAAALSSVGGLAALATSLSSVLGVAAALPAVFVGAGISFGVLAAALKDGSKVLADLGPAFSRLQDTISTNFWAKAAQPIRDLVHNLMPALQTQLGEVSSALGGFTAALANAFKKNVTPSVLAGMMGHLTDSIKIAKGALDPLVQAFTTLGTVGSQYLPRMAQAITDVSKRFNSFIQSAADSGQLKAWIDGGIEALKQLGSIAKSAVRIIGGIGSAAAKAGAGGLSGFASMMGTIADVINSPAFQGALTTFFEGAGAAMHGLAQALGPIGDMFKGLAGTLSGVMAGAGKTVGSILGKIADALNRPAFKKGLSAFFTGIEAGLQAIAPALPALSDALGTVAVFAGKLGAQLGKVLGAALKAIAPVITQVFQALQPLLPVLGTALVAAIQAVAPLIQPLVGMFLQLVPVITQLVTALMPPLIQVFNALIPALMPIVKAILPPLIQLLVQIIPIAAQIIAALAPLIVLILNRLTPVIKALMPIVKTVFTTITNVITAAMQIIKGIIQVVTGLISGNWTKVWNGIKNIFKGVWNGIAAIVKGQINLVKNVIKAAWNIIKSVTTSTFNAIRSLVSGALGAISSIVSSGVSHVSGAISGAWNAVSGATRSAWNAVVGFIRDAINGAISVVQSIGGSVKSALAGAGSWLVGAGQNIVQGLIDGIRGWISRAAQWAAHLASRVLNAAKSALGIASPSKEFMKIGVYSAEGMMQGMDSQNAAVQRSGAAMARAALTGGGAASNVGQSQASGAGVTVNVYNPLNEPTSRTVEKTSAKLALAGAI